MNLGNNGVLSDQLASPRHTLISRLGFLFALSLLLLTALLLHTSFHSLAVTSVLSGFYGIGEDDVTVTAAGHRAAPPNTAPNQAFGGGQDRVILNLSSVRKRNHLEDFVRNESLSSVDNGSSLHGTTEEANDGVSDPKVLLLQKGEEKANDQRISFGEKEITNQSEGDCDLFSGKWVRHYSRPYYPPGSCPFVDRHFDCQRNGRPDHAYYLNWKWKPTACPLPRLNATDFLVRLRGKRLVFVGDSLNRNMWESMVCILHRRIRNKKRVYEISGRSDFKKKGFYAFRFEDYNCSVDFVAAPFLVRPSSYNRANGSIETLRLDLMDHTTTMYHDAEILVFNTGHWWTHEKTSRGEDYYQEGNHVYPRLKALEAYRKALTTWARWIDKNVDSSKTQVFFRGYSVTHFWYGFLFLSPFALTLGLIAIRLLLTCICFCIPQSAQLTQ